MSDDELKIERAVECIVSGLTGMDGLPVKTCPVLMFSDATLEVRTSISLLVGPGYTMSEYVFDRLKMGIVDSRKSHGTSTVGR